MNDSTARLAALIEKYRSGTISEPEKNELLAAATRSEVLKALLRDMEHSFLADDSPDVVLEPHRAERMRSHMENYIRPVRNIRVLRRWIVSAAAVLIGVLGGLFVLNGVATDTVVWHQVATILGEQRRVVLPDSSVIHLNGGSTLSYPDRFADNQRVVILKGEAFFDISRDGSRPFFVIGKRFTTQVLGTSFNVDTEVAPGIAVAEGKVQVIGIDEHTVKRTLDKPASLWERVGLGRQSRLDAAWSEGGRNEQLLEADQYVTIDTLSGVMSRGQGVGPNWKDGQLAFFNVSIEHIARHLTRYYGEEIVVADGIKGCEVTLPTTNKSLAQILAILARLREGQATKKQDTWYLGGRGC